METVRVFIENEAGSDKKSNYDEKTLEYVKTVKVSRKYPYPYGFIIGTTSGDGDNVDCYVITERKLQQGSTVECEPVGMMQQKEDGMQDSNVLASLKYEKAQITESIRNELKDFVLNVFAGIEGKRMEVGDFLGREEALSFIKKCTD